jgi:hypothetical protein
MKITMNKKVERIKLILDIVEQKIKSDPKKETFLIPINEIVNLPALGDSMSIDRIFKEIKKQTKENIVIEFHDQSFEYINPKSGEIKQVAEPLAIRVHIEDINEFNKYKKQIAQQLKKGFKIPMLILDEGQLYRSDDKEKKLTYPMKMNRLPYKIVHYLAEEKQYVQTKELADRFGENSQEIRKTIGEIRQLIDERLKIPGNKIIESNNSGLGYRIKNIKLKND